MNCMMLLMGPPPEGAPNPFVSMIPFFLILAIFYFMLIRPQQKRAQEHRKLIESLKQGDEVITESGLFGKVMNVNEESVILEIAKNVKVRVLKAKVLGRQEAAAAQKKR